MADAAYETIKTLQDMLTQKNEQVKHKEEHISRLRDQMRIARESDATTIRGLQEQLSSTGNNALNKLQELMNRPINSGGAEARAKSKWDKKTQDEITHMMSQKDIEIKKL